MAMKRCSWGIAIVIAAVAIPLVTSGVSSVTLKGGDMRAFRGADECGSCWLANFWTCQECMKEGPEDHYVYCSSSNKFVWRMEGVKGKDAGECDEYGIDCGEYYDCEDDEWCYFDCGLVEGGCDGCSHWTGDEC